MTHSLSVVRRASTRLIVRGLMCGGLLACSSTVGPENAGACQQTYEFGNSGCLEITGQVVGLSGQPLAGISIYPSAPPGPQLFNLGSAKTDAAGVFTVRAWRMCCQTPAVGPDTLSLWVRGLDSRTVPPRVQDSVLVHATISPIGTIPKPTSIRLILSAP